MDISDMPLGLTSKALIKDSLGKRWACGERKGVRSTKTAALWLKNGQTAIERCAQTGLPVQEEPPLSSPLLCSPLTLHTNDCKVIR